MEETAKKLYVREDFERNHAAIETAFSFLYDKHGRMPTYREIGNRCNLSRTTVYKHFKKITLADIAPRFRSMTGKVFKGIADAAARGDAANARLFLKIMYNYSESLSVDLPDNSTLKIEIVQSNGNPKAE